MLVVSLECLQSKRCGFVDVTQINYDFRSTWNLFDGKFMCSSKYAHFISYR